MRSGIGRLIIILLLLSLMLIEGSNKAIKPSYIYSELPLREQLALSRGKVGARREIATEDHRPKPIDELIIMTFNICHGVNRQDEESLDSIIESIKDTEAQIICLQEVDRFMPRSGLKDQAKEIAEALGYYYVYGETINVMGVKYGNAIISKFSILEHENLKLPGDSLETRGLLGAKIDVEGTLFEVYTTHLGLDSRDRKQQIKAINLSIEQSTQPLILMGDFNGEPFNTEMKEISSFFLDIAIETQKEDLYTYAFYSDLPNTRVDRIYISQDIEVIDHYVIESNISDHSMVLGIISTSPTIKEGLMASIGNNK